jgi:hypothetical protein
MSLEKSKLIDTFLLAEGVTRPTARKFKTMTNKVAGLIERCAPALTDKQSLRLVIMWASEITDELETDTEASTYIEALGVIAVHLRQMEEETENDWMSRMKTAVELNVELLLGAVRASERIDALNTEIIADSPRVNPAGITTKQPPANTQAQNTPNTQQFDQTEMWNRFEQRDRERQQAFEEMQEMLLRQHAEHETERLEWQRKDRERGNDHQDPMSGLSAQESRILQTLLKDNDSDGPELLTALKKLLKDKEDKAMITDSESEESCEKSLRRKASKVDGMIQEEKRYTYPNKAARMNHEDFMRTWDMELARLTRGRPDSSSAQYDDLRLEELQRLLKLSHKAMMSVKDADAKARRAAGKMYQAIVDLVYETKAMSMCPSARYAAAMFFRQQLCDSREKERAKDDHVVRYGNLVDAVTQKHARSFSQGTGQQWAPRTGAYNGARRGQSGGRNNYAQQPQNPQQQQRPQPQPTPARQGI